MHTPLGLKRLLVGGSLGFGIPAAGRGLWVSDRDCRPQGCAEVREIVRTCNAPCTTFINWPYVPSARTTLSHDTTMPSSVTAERPPDWKRVVQRRHAHTALRTQIDLGRRPLRRWASRTALSIFAGMPT